MIHKLDKRGSLEPNKVESTLVRVLKVIPSVVTFICLSVFVYGTGTRVSSMESIVYNSVVGLTFLV